jgi:hypothetical protein
MGLRLSGCAWEAAAGLVGLSLNGWVRAALCSQAELDEVLAREAGSDEETGRSAAGSSALG